VQYVTSARLNLLQAAPTSSMYLTCFVRLILLNLMTLQYLVKYKSRSNRDSEPLRNVLNSTDTSCIFVVLIHPIC
jgi:hypothetical protein